MSLPAPRRERLVAAILADTDSVRVLDSPHRCRTVEEGNNRCQFIFRITGVSE